MQRTLTLTLSLAILAAAGASVQAQDPADVSPDVYRVVYANEHVRVIEMELPAGRSDRTHSHPHAWIYFVAGGTVGITAPDGSIRSGTIVTGDDFWQEPTTHWIENTGKSVIRAVAFELLEPVGTEVSVEHDPATVAPETNTEIFENEFVRVVETITPPGGGGELHQHMSMVVYALALAELEITGADGTSRRVVLQAGTAVWSGPVTHRVRNVGTTTSHLLHVEIK